MARKTVEQYARFCREAYPVPAQVGRRIAVDVGANVGGFALAYADRFDTILCIEPYKATFSELVANTALLPNVRCLNLAVGRRSGELVTLRAHKHHAEDSACHSTRSHEEWGEIVDMVPSISYKSLTEMVGQSINFLKIDCEGAEFDFLLPCMANLEVEAIGIEMHAQWPKECEVLRRHLFHSGFVPVFEKIVDPHENSVWLLGDMTDAPCPKGVCNATSLG